MRYCHANGPQPMADYQVGWSPTENAKLPTQKSRSGRDGWLVYTQIPLINGSNQSNKRSDIT